MKKQEIESAVIDYIESKDTDYAIMITGEWGVGKTYFLKNNLYETFRKVNLLPIYISLIGYSSISALMDSIFSKINPLYKKSQEYSKAKSEGKYIENILLEGKKKTPLIPSNYILCFDDLERIHPSFFKEALGYINSFIEHEKVKVTFLCNEKEIKIKNYNTTKEKYISYTYELESNIKEYLDEYEFYNKENKGKIDIPFDKNILQTALTTVNHHNIRTVKFTLDRYKKIYLNIKDELTELEYQDSLLTSIQLFTFVWCIENKKRNLLNEIYAEKVQNEDSIKSFVAKETNNIRAKYFQFSNLNEDSYFIFLSIFNFLIKGYLEDEILKVELLKLNLRCKENSELATKKYEKSKEEIILDKLRQPELLDYERYMGLIEEIKVGLENNIFSLANIIPMYSDLVHIESYNIDGTRLTNSLENSFRNSIKYLIENNDLSELSTSSARDQYYWGDKNIHPEKTRNFIDFTFDLLYNKEKGKSEQVREDIINKLKENTIISSQAEFANIDSEELSKEENIKAIFEALKTAHPKSILSFKDFIRERYSIKDSIIPNELRNEQFFIETLHKLLDTYIEELKSFQKISLKKLNHILSEAIKLNKRLS